MKKLSQVLVIFCLTLGSFAWSQEDQQQEEKIDCDNAMSTYEMNYCVSASGDEVDKELNLVYQQLIKKIRTSGEPKSVANEKVAYLRKAQRAWIILRDAECEFDNYDSRGGSIHNIEFESCLKELTARRVTELKAKTADSGL